MTSIGEKVFNPDRPREIEQRPLSDPWQCIMCLYENDNKIHVCSVCDTPNYLGKIANLEAELRKWRDEAIFVGAGAKRQTDLRDVELSTLKKASSDLQSKLQSKEEELKMATSRFTKEKAALQQRANDDNVKSQSAVSELQEKLALEEGKLRSALEQCRVHTEALDRATKALEKAEQKALVYLDLDRDLRKEKMNLSEELGTERFNNEKLQDEVKKLQALRDQSQAEVTKLKDQVDELTDLAVSKETEMTRLKDQIKDLKAKHDEATELKDQIARLTASERYLTTELKKHEAAEFNLKKRSGDLSLRLAVELKAFEAERKLRFAAAILDTARRALERNIGCDEEELYPNTEGDVELMDPSDGQSVASEQINVLNGAYVLMEELTAKLTAAKKDLLNCLQDPQFSRLIASEIASAEDSKHNFDVDRLWNDIESAAEDENYDVSNLRTKIRHLVEVETMIESATQSWQTLADCQLALVAERLRAAKRELHEIKPNSIIPELQPEHAGSAYQPRVDDFEHPERSDCPSRTFVSVTILFFAVLIGLVYQFGRFPQDEFL